MDRSYIDDLSDAVSAVSQDRLSDDTDFLIGHNISLNNLNDSCLDTRSSTTTDLLYQQEITDAETETNKLAYQYTSKSQSHSPSKDARSPVIYNIDPKAKEDFIEDDYYKTKSTNLTFQNESIINNVSGESYRSSKHEIIVNSEFTEKLSAGPDSKDQQSNFSKVKRTSNSNDSTKSADPLKTSRSSKDSSSNWKYRSVDAFSDEDSINIGKSVTSRAGIQIDSFSGDVQVLDDKVKEGEELLARLLGKVTLAESLHSFSAARKETYKKGTSYGENPGNESHRTQTSASPRRHSIGNNEISASESKASSVKSENKGNELRKSDWRKNVSVQQTEMKNQENITRNTNSPLSDRSERSRVSAASSQYNETEPQDRSRASSLDKYQRKQQDMELTTSTPQKTNWPVSPIKRHSDPEVEESELLLAKNERKLKDLRFSIEQEIIRKEAVMREISTAEDGLLKVKKNIQSLEQLAEQHRKQTVSTRAELMELEQQRNESQRKLNEVTEDLKRQKKELEALPVELKESNISTKIAMLQDERDELKRECKILREKAKDVDHANNNNMELMKKLRNLQEQLYNEQDSSRDKIRAIREELESERRKAVESNIEQMNSIRKIREESMEAKKKEVDAVIGKLEKEKLAEIESINNRFQRDIKKLHQKNEELEEENQKLITSNSERLNKVQEQSETNHKREIENIVKKMKKENDSEMAILSQRHKRQIEELDLQIKTKQSEIENLQALLKQQAEATRILGEKLRNEAKEQVCMAVEKERNSRLEELRKTELELEKVKEERDAATSGNSTVLADKESQNERMRNIINKLKKELEDARQENYEAREEKFQAILKTRTEMKGECDRLKTRLRELEKVEQTIILEINEECLKTAAVTGGTYPTIRRNYSFDAENNSALEDALATLRLSSNDLRKQVMKYKKKYEESRISNESLNQTDKSDRDSSVDRSRTPDRKRTPDRARTPDRVRTPDAMKSSLNGSSDESRSARILKHLQSRVKQLRQGNESMKKSFGSDDMEHDLDSTNGSFTPDQGEINDSFVAPNAETQRLEAALKSAEGQAQKYSTLLNQKMAENTKLQKMLTQASKENIKLERLHSILQHKMATSAAM